MKDGFTLVEIIIVIALIAVGLSFAGYGLSIVYDSSVDAMANDYLTEIRDLRYRTLTEVDSSYQMVVLYDSVKDQYGYKIEKRFFDTSLDPDGYNIVEVERKFFQSTLRIDVYDDAQVDPNLAYIEVKEFLAAASSPEAITIRFDSATGGLTTTDFNGNAVEFLIATQLSPGSHGILHLRSNGYSNTVRELDFVRYTGRVTLHEK